jgi:hypothetical protein
MRWVDPRRRWLAWRRLRAAGRHLQRAALDHQRYALVEAERPPWDGRFSSGAATPAQLPAQVLPNLLYSDGQPWVLYRGGVQVDRIVVLEGDVATAGASLAADDNLRTVLTDFLASP